MRSLIVSVFLCLPATQSHNRGKDDKSVGLFTTRRNEFLQNFDFSVGPLQSSKQKKDKKSGSTNESYVSNRQNGEIYTHIGERKLQGRNQQKIRGNRKRNKRRGYFSYHFWELKHGPTKILCQANSARKCPHIKGGGSWRSASKPPNLEPGNCNWVIVVKIGVKLICSKEYIKYCRKIVGGGAWHQSGKPGYGFWIQKHGSTTIYCKAININYCPFIQRGEWDFVQKKYINTKCPGKAKWVLVLINCTLYCDQADSKRCRKLYRSEAWLEFSTYTGNFWQITSKGVMILCSATYIKHCPTVKVDEEWEVYGVNDESHHNARWILVIQRCTLYCNQTSVKSCNRLYSHRKWRRFKSKKQLTTRIIGWWRQKHGSVVIVCNANYMRNCPTIHGGTWISDKNVNVDHPGNAKWIVILKHCTLYCNKVDVQECTRMNDWKDWQEFPAEAFSKVITGSVGFWTRNHGYMEIFCKADELKNCANIRGGGKWELVAYQRDWSEYPNHAIMFMFGVNCNIYCDLYSLNTCADFYRGRWVKIKQSRRKPSVGGWWENTNRHVRIICIARNGNDCPIVTGFGGWKYLTSITSMITVPQDGHWMLTIKTIKLVCDAQKLHKCPKIVGSGSWKKLHRHEPTTSSPSSDFITFGPL